MLTAAGLAVPHAKADAPLPPPQDKTVCSQNGAFCAVMDAGSVRTNVVKDGKVLWSMPGWFRDAHLADDGEHLVVGYQGLGLLQWDYRPQTTLITFWRRGRLLRRVPLSEVIEDTDNLELTVSHFRWGRTLGIDGQGRFLVHTVEDRRMAFDIESGKLLEAWPAPFDR